MQYSVTFSTSEYLFLHFMERILHIETATDICSVCIAEEGKVTAVRETGESRSHASVLTVFVEELMQERSLKISDFDAIAVSMGPGSFTGLRIGVTVAKGFCYGASLPLIAVPTLESMFRGFLQLNHSFDVNDLFIPMIDARRMEVYTAVFNNMGEILKPTSAMIIDNNSFSDLIADHTLHFFGTGANKLTETIVNPNADFTRNFHISSVFMTDIALEKFHKKDFEDAAYFEPYYLKDFITTIPKKNLLSGTTKSV